MTTDHSQLLELAASEFTESARAGRQPSVEAYALRYPQIAEDIRRTFPMLLLMDDLAAEQADPQGADGLTHPASEPLQIKGYRLLREIGRGGMGVVYEAEQENLQRSVALKVLPKRLAGSEQSIKRFHLEARAAGQLHHPHIVPIYDVEQTGETIFYTMQLIRGHSLAELIHELRRVRDADGHEVTPREPISLTAESLRDEQLPGADLESPSTTDHAAPATPSPQSSPTSTLSGSPGSTVYYRNVAQIIRHVASALAFAHARGIVHRDIKPSNLLIDDRFHVWVTDFGLAKVDDADITHEGDLIGTVRYMSPEQLRGWADPRSDIYALGITLYEMLALQPAFEAQDQGRLLKLVDEELPSQLRFVDFRIPRDLEAIVFKAIAKEPRDRYSSAERLMEDLDRFLIGAPVLAARVSLFHWLRNRVYAHRRVLLALASLSLAVLVTALVLTQQSAREMRTLNRQFQQQQASLDNALYEDKIRRALFAYSEGEVATSSAIVESIEREALTPYVKPGLEWNLLQKVAGHFACELTMLGHEGEVLEFAEVPGKSQIVSSGKDGSVRVWDTQTGECLNVFQIEGNELAAIAVSHDGKTFFAGSQRVGQYRLSDGKKLRTVVEHPGTVEQIRLFDSNTLTTGARYKTIKLTSLDTPARLLKEFHSGGRSSTSLSSDMGLVASYREKSGMPERIRIWDRDTGEYMETVWDQESRIRFLVRSISEDWIAGTGMYGVQTRFFEPTNGHVLGEFTHSHTVNYVAYSEATRVLAVAHINGQLRFMRLPERASKDWPQPEWEFSFATHLGRIHHVAFLEDGRVCSCGRDGAIRIWSPPTPPFLSLGWPGRYHAAGDVDRDGNVITLARDGNQEHIVLRCGSLHSDEWQDFALPPGANWTMCFSPDGRRIAIGGMNECFLLDSQSKELVGRAAHVLEKERKTVAGLVYTHDGSRIASGSEVLLVLRDAETLEPIHSLPIASERVQFSPDDSQIVVTNREGKITVLNSETLETQATWDSFVSVNCFQWVRQGELLAGHEDGRITCWSTVDGKQKFELRGHHYGITSLAVSPDQRRLVSSGHESVLLWNLETKQLLGTIYRKPWKDGSAVGAVRFLPGSQSFLIVRQTSLDGPHMMLWDLDEM